MTRKVAMFIHGWGASNKIWYKHGLIKKGSPLIDLFREYGYDIVEVNLPDKFVSQEKDFHWYAEHIAGLVEDEVETHMVYPRCPYCNQPLLDETPTEAKPADEITIIAHSMGGVASRLYLKSDDIGNAAAKRKVTRAITISSPHHGTNVPIMEIVRTLADILVLGAGTVAYSVLGTTPCYQQAKPGSEFLKELNRSFECPRNVDFHTIWCKGDKVVAPRHSAVITGASNHFIDNKRVVHQNVCWYQYTIDIVREILDGDSTPMGLQGYPSTTGCKIAGEHSWFPKAFPEKWYTWTCRNDGCDEEQVSKWVPGVLGCEIGIIDESMRWHKWRQTGQKKYKCEKCDTSKIVTSRPSRRGSCKKPFPKYHRWRLQSYEWECKNDGCNKKVWSKLKPQLLGCKIGQTKKKHHFWKKVDKQYRYEFECASCGVTEIKS